MSDDEAAPTRLGPAQLALPLVLFLATCLSTTVIGAGASKSGTLLAGLDYSVPLMSILLAHEFGHYIAARIHRVPASLPHFIPFPLPPLGTMGAVILMRDRIRSRDALLDIGAAGPLAGMCVALPVLVYGIVQSPVEPDPQGVPYMIEGRSLLYLGLLRALKGPIPDGHDIMLTPTAFAGWVGLLVTMINLIPALQLDGGHVACALLGDRFDRLSRFVRKLLLPLALLVGLYYGAQAWTDGKRGDALQNELMPATQWLTWWLLLTLLGRRDRPEHPPPDPGPLSPRRRLIAIGTLVLFALLFMPAWLRSVEPTGAAG